MSIDKKLYQLYLSCVSESERLELKKYNHEQLEFAFNRPLEFGTGGIREKMGIGPSLLNRYTIMQITKGLVDYLLVNKLMNGVAISYDNRKDSRVFAFTASRVLSSYGIKSYVFNSLRPTPMLSFLVLYKKCSAGIMITASHNPKEYNGYKVYDSSGAQFGLEEAESLAQFINKIKNPFIIKAFDTSLVETIEDDFDNIYFEYLKRIPINETSMSARIIYSPSHGTGGEVIPKYLETLGYIVTRTRTESYPDPNFSNMESPNPENASAFINSIAAARAVKAQFIMITDPDADRLGICYIDNNDVPHYLTGNQTAVIELYYILTEKKNIKKGYVCTTNVTTPLIIKIAEKYGQKVKVTPTGFKFIGQWSRLIEGKYPYIFGCEESYGTLIKDYVRDKDAIQACVMLAEIYNYCVDKDITILDYLDKIYKEFGYYHEYTNNVSFASLDSKERISSIMNAFREANHLFDNLKVKEDLLFETIKDDSEFVTDYRGLNVLKFIFNDDSYVVLRPSGTEPKIKVYYSACGASMDEAKNRVKELEQTIKKKMEEIVYV